MISHEHPKSKLLTHAISWERGVRDKRPRVTARVREKAYDDLVDAILKRDDLGSSRRAVTALGERILGRRIADELRSTRMPDGAPRPHPRAAVSLDAPVFDAGAGRQALRYDHVIAGNVEAEVINRDEVRRYLDTASKADAVTHEIMVRYGLGQGPEDIAGHVGLTVNTVSARKCRFVARHRDSFR